MAGFATPARRVALLSIVAALLGVLAGPPGTAAAADPAPAPELTLSAQTRTEPDTVVLTYTVTNRGSTPCLLPAVADASLHVTAVTRDGDAVVASPGIASYIGGWDAAVADSLTSVAPGGAVTVAVAAFRPAAAPETLRLETVDGLPGGAAMTAAWDLAPHGRYTVAAVFAVPPVRAGTCAGVSGVATTAFVVGADRGNPWLPAALIAGLGIAVAVALAVLLARRRRTRRTGTLVVALLVAGLVAGNGRQPAAAEIVPPGDAGLYESVGACLAQFRRPGFDPAGLVDPAVRPGSPPIEIIRITAGTHGQGTRTDPIDLTDPAKGSRIQWDPAAAFVLDGVPHTPCSALYHEMQHAMDFRDGVDGRTGECDGVPVSDLHAVAAENGFRAKAGLPQRMRYHGTPIPPTTYQQCLDRLRKEKPGTGKNTGGGGGSGIGNGPGGSPGGSWLFGDPHLATTDGRLYDFQAAGEFLAVTGDGLEVQVRLQPLPGSTTVSAVTAVAVRSGASRATWTMRDGTMTALLDGRALAVGADGGAEFGAGGSITARDSALSWGGMPGYTVRWPDGTQLFVDATAYWGVRVGFTPAAGRSGAIGGLLGNADGDPDNDLVARSGGALLPADPSYEQLYRAFGDSWRIGADTAFDYRPGESTATFTDPAFPQRVLTVADLTPERRRRAELACAAAGVDSGALLEACVLDVAQTGQPTFAFTAARTGAEDDALAAAPARHLRPAEGPATSAPARPGDDLGPGATITGSIPDAAGSAQFPFPAAAGDVAYFQGGDCTAPRAAAQTWTIRALTGELGEYHGVVDTCQDIGRVSFARDGTYQIEISGPGAFRFSWVPARPDRRLPLPIGEEIAGRIDSPGEADLFPFAVRAGQSLTFRPSPGCTDVGLHWYLITADGQSEGRGIAGTCTEMGPIRFDHDGDYLLRIDSGTRTAVGDYRFTAVPG